MALSIDEHDESKEIAAALQQALSSNSKTALLVGLINAKVSVKSRKELEDAIDSGKQIIFQLCVKDGKVSRPRYDVIIDFTTKEVSVLHLGHKQMLDFSKFIIQEGGILEKSTDSITT